MMTSAEEFVSLRNSERREDYLRAANDSASSEVWSDVLARFPEMRIWVAHNKTVPMGILAILARDPNSDVRSAVAMKNKLSVDLMAVLAEDPDDSVRERIAYNKNTPPEILQRLANDRCERVSAHSRSRLRQDG